ncbi:FUSC family protein [Bdellovibrio sp. 22V]|uniref:FUSC family protein n=1 Tax=Bdellovibrio TaxID=958 RepID=UPI002543930E|nr:FUSC family protein [Bdellovibrio sp. 22V]WII73857.1 FUSC family protein [Bdellovibrio sp. 22V]
MNLRGHLEEVLRINPVPSPWPRMVVSAFATFIPLMVGLFLNQLPISIFGALFGFLLVLNDHLGTLGHRLWVITLTFLIMLGGLLLGVLTHNHPLLLFPILLCLTYWMGLSAAKGAELERAVLFGTFQVLAGTYTGVRMQYLAPLLLYAFLGYLCVVVILSCLVFIRRHNPNPFARLRKALKDSLTTEKHRHLYAFAYSFCVLSSLFIVDYFKMNHGYWAVGTVLIIMRPEPKASIYRNIQRFFGTLIGVLLAEALIFTIHSPWIAIPVLAFISFWGPWALSRSYWLGSAVMSVMVLLLLDMPYLERGDLHTPLLRLQATGVGCLFSLIGVVIANPQILWKDAPPKE